MRSCDHIYAVVAHDDKECPLDVANEKIVELESEVESLKSEIAGHECEPCHYPHVPNATAP